VKTMMMTCTRVMHILWRWARCCFVEHLGIPLRGLCIADLDSHLLWDVQQHMQLT